FRPRQLELIEARLIDGERQVRVAFDWREGLPTGDHRCIVQPRAANAAVTSLFIAPERCYLPPALRDSGRGWGIATQLYGLVSSGGWGMGDFTALSRLTAESA